MIKINRFLRNLKYNIFGNWTLESFKFWYFYICFVISVLVLSYCPTSQILRHEFLLSITKYHWWFTYLMHFIGLIFFGYGLKEPLAQRVHNAKKKKEVKDAIKDLMTKVKKRREFDI